MAGRRHDRAAVLTVLCSVVTFIALFVTVLHFDYRSQAAMGSEPSYGWLPPLAALLFAISLIWLLVNHSNVRGSHADTSEAECSTCGRELRRDWRLCPYCGALVGSSGKIDAGASVLPRGDGVLSRPE